MTLSLNIIGAGKLGKTLGLLFHQQQIQIQTILNQHMGSTREAIEFIGSGTMCTSLETCHDADITLIAVPDNKIPEIVDKIYTLNLIKHNSIVFHCSGALSSQILKKLPASVMSIHPIKSFASPHLSASSFPGTVCAYEGDSKALDVILPIFSAMGAQCVPINETHKSMYHAGCVLASNYLITLAENAKTCLIDSGIAESAALDITLNLMENTINNLKHTRCTKSALTGPLQRGDDATIHNHLLALKDTEYLELYQILGRSTLKLTEHEQDVLQRLLNKLK